MIRVSRSKPCPICEKPDWCIITDDERTAVCMRVQSAKIARNGGWIHHLSDERPTFKPLPRPRVESKPVLHNAGTMIEEWIGETSPDRLYAFAASLGVTAQALAEIGACWAKAHEAWAFPMRDGAGRTVGIRLRSESGDKWAVRGSREGLFYPEHVPDDHIAVVCEGPTDTAAALTLGLWAVGRPSCQGAADAVRAMCQRLLVTHLVIVADNDPPKQRPDGSWWQPGLSGIQKLVETVGLPHKVIYPPAKDFRAWVATGAMRDDFDQLANQQRWRNYGW